MAGNNSTVHIKLTADSADAVKKIAAVEKQATQTASKTEKSFAESGTKVKGHFSGLSNVISNFSESAAAGPAAAAAAIGVSFLGIAKSAISAAEEFDTAHARLQAAVNNTGESFAKSEKPITEADDKLRALGFTSTETEAAMVPLVNATHSVGKATELMGLAADIARARNISLEEASSKLAQIELGRYKGLVKLGAVSAEHVKDIHSQADAEKALATVVGGQAAAYTTTYAGKIAVLKSNLDELKVTLGNALIPTINQFTGVLSGGLNAVNNLSSGHKNLLGSLVSTGVRASLDVGTFGQYELALKAFGHTTTTVKGAQDALKESTQKLAEDRANASTSTKQLSIDQAAYDEASKKAKAITDGLKTSTENKTASDKAAAEAIKAHNDSLKNLYDTENSVLDSSLSLDEQNHKLIDTFQKYSDVQKVVIAQHGKDKDSVEAFVQANYDLQHGIIGTSEAAKTNAENMQRLSNAQHHVATETGVAVAGHQAQIKELQLLAAEFPPLAAQIQDYINRIGGVPTFVKTTLALDFVSNLSTVQTFFPGFGKRAAGGPVTAGSSYLVGERGPELFTPHTSGNISPNGSGVTINVAVSGSNARDLVNDIALEIQNGGGRNLQRALGVA